MSSPAQRRAAVARAAVKVSQLAPATLDVVRYQPSEIARCRWPQCGAWIEWVETLDHGLLPITHPLRELAERPIDDRTVTTIEAVQVHLACCPEAPGWLRRRWGGTPEIPADRGAHSGGDPPRHPVACAACAGRTGQRRVAR